MRRPRISEFLFSGATVADGTRPAANWGTSVTPAQDAYGASYANLGVLSSTYDVYEWSLNVHNVGVNTASRITMVKLGIDLAGGTSFTDFLTDVCVGTPAQQANFSGAEKIDAWRIRKRIPAGASIGIKSAVHSATLTALRAWIFDARGRPTRPELARTHEYCDTFGTSIANCQGTVVVPGTVSEGAWTEIGTLARKLEWFEYALALDETNVATAAQLYTDIALGDATNKRPIITNHATIYTTTEMSYREGPAGVAAVGNSGDKIYARIQCPITLPAGAFSVGVYGCGG